MTNKTASFELPQTEFYTVFEDGVEYPCSDGQPMADNTLQFDWMALLKWNLEAMYSHRDDVFVAGDHLIYPTKGENTIRVAPDVYVAFGPKKGHRGSYRVWREGNVFPQVVFEVWSPSNTETEMNEKVRDFYNKFGAEECYIVHPEKPAFVDAWLRREPVAAHSSDKRFH